MEYLKEGIGLRAMAQRDPLVEYQREGFTLFQNTMGQIKEESLGLLYNLEVQVRPAAGPGDHVHLEGGGLENAEQPIDESKLSFTAPDEDGHTAVSGAGAGANQKRPAGRANAAARQIAAQPAAPTERGAFGQQVPADAAEAAQPMNRAQRRKKK
jgi:preprotein translocase subunit SecA